MVTYIKSKKKVGLSEDNFEVMFEDLEDSFMLKHIAVLFLALEAIIIVSAVVATFIGMVIVSLALNTADPKIALEITFEIVKWLVLIEFIVLHWMLIKGYGKATKQLSIIKKVLEGYMVK